jgi:diguanylate cyclase (GGDEF)-like protein
MRGSWLCPTELDRSRVVDANERVRMIRMVGSGAVGLALVVCAPWMGWWTLILFSLSVLNFANVGYRMDRSAHPERVSAWAIVITLLLIGSGVVLSGGPKSPALPWLVLPAGMVAARFRPQVVLVGLLMATSIILATTLGAYPTATINDPSPVIATLALLVGVVSIVWALQAAELHHRSEAILDPLTGLLNRHALAPRFIELTLQARLTQQPVCMLLCDIDNFKAVNDGHGHDHGDAVLRDVAYAMRKQLRSFELIYRLGGEEFLIVLPGIELAGAQEIAERLRVSVEQTRPLGIGVTISCGLTAGAGDQVDYDAMFKEADEALYEAKRSGRNRVVTAPGAAPAAEAPPAGAIAAPTSPSPEPAQTQAEALLA